MRKTANERVRKSAKLDGRQDLYIPGNFRHCRCHIIILYCIIFIYKTTTARFRSILFYSVRSRKLEPSFLSFIFHTKAVTDAACATLSALFLISYVSNGGYSVHEVRSYREHDNRNSHHRKISFFSFAEYHKIPYDRTPCLNHMQNNEPIRMLALANYQQKIVFTVINSRSVSIS